MTTRPRLARWVAAAELPLVAAMAPALLAPTPPRLLVLVAVPLMWLAARQAGLGWVTRTPFNVALWLMLSMIGVSVFTTPDIAFSLDKIAGLILGILVFWALCRWFTNRDRLTLGVAGLILAGTTLGILGLVGVGIPNKFPLLSAMGSLLPRLISGVPGAENGFNPNGVAGGLVLVIPLQVAVLWSARTWRRRPLALVQVALLLVTSGAALLMQSRTAWLGLLFGMAVLLLSHARGRHRMTACAMAVLLVATAGTGLLMVDDAPTDEPLNAAFSVAQRSELWSAGLDAIRDSPLTGTGMNMFRRVITVRYPTRLIPPNFDIAHAHNHVLQAALDLGLPGLVAYLAVWFIAGLLLLRVVGQAADPWDRAVAGGLMGGFAAFFIFGLADTIALGSKVGLLFWIALALVASVHQIARQDTSEVRDRAR